MKRKKPPTPRHTEPATIKEIAARANVSIGTIDRVVHGRGRVAPETERRVRRIIQESGYRPNIYASHLSRAKTYHFGVVVPLRDQDSGFWAQALAGAEKAARELAHFRVRLKYFFYDRHEEEQFKRVERQVLSSPLDGLVIAPVLYRPVTELIRKLPAHVPYAFINTALPGLEPLSSIGQDSRQSGLVCGRLIGLLVKPPATVAVVLTVPDDPHIRARADGLAEAFAGRDNVSVREYELFTPEDPGKTKAVVEEMLAANPALAGVFVANVAVHAVAAGLKARAPGRKVFVIGYDLIPRNVELLQSGAIDFLISQKPERQGYEGVYALYRAVALKDKIRKTVNLPIDIITRENVGFYDTH